MSRPTNVKYMSLVVVKYPCLQTLDRSDPPPRTGIPILSPCWSSSSINTPSIVITCWRELRNRRPPLLCFRLFPRQTDLLPPATAVDPPIGRPKDPPTPSPRHTTFLSSPPPPPPQKSLAACAPSSSPRPSYTSISLGPGTPPAGALPASPTVRATAGDRYVRHGVAFLLLVRTGLIRTPCNLSISDLIFVAIWARGFPPSPPVFLCSASVALRHLRRPPPSPLHRVGGDSSES